MLKNVIRMLLGLFMLIAGISHLTFARETFQAQVPDWVPFSKDFIVLSSGVVEIFLGVFMLFFTKYKALAGLALALFLILVFPGNIAQYLDHRDGFGLDTDTKRLIRLFFQPLLIFAALYSTNALKIFKKS